MEQRNPTLRLGLSQAFHNKEPRPGYTRAAFGDSFKPSAVTALELCQHILAGRAWTPGNFDGNTRKNETFISSQIIVLDCDDNVSVADALAVPFVRRHAFIVHPSASSSPEKYKTRIGFALSKPVDEAAHEQWSALARAVGEHTGLKVDEASYKPAQPYFGSTNRVEEPYINADAVLPLEVAGALTADQARNDYANEHRRAERPLVKITGNRAEAYARRTLENALNRLASAPQGERNNTTYSVAYGLFCKVKGDWPGLDQFTVRRELEAIVSGWPNVAKSRGTIERAYQAATPEVLELPAYDDGATSPPRPLYEQQPGDEIAPEPDSFTEWGQGGLPDEWRSALLNYQPQAAPVAELINEAVRRGLIDVDNVTINGLYTASESMGAGFAKSTVYNMVNGIGAEFFQESPICSYGIPEEKVRKTPGGRPTTSYRITPLNELRAYLEACATPRIYERMHPTETTPIGRTAVLARPTVGMLRDLGYGDTAKDAARDLDTALAPAYALQGNIQDRMAYRATKQRRRLSTGLNDTYSSPMPDGWQIGNVSLYRAAYCRALRDSNPDITRKEIARALGVDIRSVNAIIERAGLESVKQPLVEHVVTSAPVNAFQQIKSRGYELRGYPLKIESRVNGRAVLSELYQADTVETFVQNARAYGAEVIVSYQVANVQEVVRDTPPERAPRAPRTEQSQPTEEPKESSEMQTAEPPYYGPHYNPAWLKAWCKLAMRYLGWQQPDGRLITPDGEIVADDASHDELAAILMDYARPAPETQVQADEIDYADPLIVVALELGARIKRHPLEAR